MNLKQKFVDLARLLILPVLLIFIMVILLWTPRENVRAQNNGTSGTFTVAQLAFNASHTASATSPIFNNVGQSAHYLTFCVTQTASGFSFDLTMEESFDGTTNWIPIASVHVITNPNPTQCGVLQAGGYYQNVRATIANNANLQVISSWYQATSGPISFAPTGTSIFGATAPIVCNQNVVLTFTAADTKSVADPIPGKTPAVCGFQVSYTAPAVTGDYEFFSNFGPACSSLLGPSWTTSTLATTPQMFTVGGGQGAILTGHLGSGICLAGSGVQKATVSISYTYI